MLWCRLADSRLVSPYHVAPSFQSSRTQFAHKRVMTNFTTNDCISCALIYPRARNKHIHIIDMFALNIFSDMRVLRILKCLFIRRASRVPLRGYIKHRRISKSVERLLRCIIEINKPACLRTWYARNWSTANIPPLCLQSMLRWFSEFSCRSTGRASRSGGSNEFISGYIRVYNDSRPSARCLF